MSNGNSRREVPMSHDEQSHYVRTQEYTVMPQYLNSMRLPGSLGAAYLGLSGTSNDDTVIVDRKVFDRDTHEFAEGDFVCPGFFNHVDLGGFTRRFNPSQWTYDMRRQAQSVFPFLSLGPSSCLRDTDYIRSQGFTLLLAIRSRHSALARLVSGEKAAAEAGIMADTIDVLDNQELSSAFPRAIRRINDHLAGVDVGTDGMMPNVQKQKRKVLVFCESGNERSAGVVIAYVMVMLNVHSAEATHMIQQRRFCVSIEDNMKCILAAFESILSAKRDVERARQIIVRGAATLAPPSAPPLLTKKRSFQDHKDDDIAIGEDEMDMDADEDPFYDRMPNAPFQDRIV
ncbi:Protein-tyrosine/Dual-specificity phosphatase [Penicillium coprophilum]|uniref:Protein-tyrosine/Dual-specificity phosphatase n=1 Tax=Penicillium coprophilum TaxID=36646 RepID=UPI002392D662|nr:Protein-tyrosine/Dual-specificity phosphatase [Penicillium coprophilum]KAJ5158287.1 Protein-tyrosine/Dual-specificity phosphatase [Penicillium coprophilum]